MSIEENYVQLPEITGWETYKANLFARQPHLAVMINSDLVNVKWEEDANGSPESVKVFLKNGTLFFFEDIKALLRLKNIKATKVLH